MQVGQSAATLGYGQVTSMSSAVNLPNVGSPAAIPSGAHVFAVIVAETQDVRWRDDGTDPTGTVGMLLPKSTELVYTGNLAAIRFIETTASAKLNVTYYKAVG